MFKQYNSNPTGKHTNDCTVRAISTVLGRSWRAIFTGLSEIGYELYDMPSSNAIWGTFMRREGYTRKIIPTTCPDCYTISDFCADHPFGTYLLATGTHVVAVIDGDYYDTWDSGYEIPVYYWTKEN